MIWGGGGGDGVFSFCWGGGGGRCLFFVFVLFKCLFVYTAGEMSEIEFFCFSALRALLR